MNRKSIFVIVICVVVVLAIVGTTVGVSYAYWRENKHSSLYVLFPIEDENPSLKYQIYVPVKSNGSTTTTTSAYARIAGTPVFTNGVYSYNMDNAGDKSKIVGFALVGWYGGVSLERLEIPDEITVTVNSQSVTKPVVRIMVDPDFGDYSFSGANTVIETMIVGKNVKEVDEGAFFGMERLKSVEFVYNENATYYLYLRPYAFAGCPKLVSINNYRAKATGWDEGTVYQGSGSAV